MALHFPNSSELPGPFLFILFLEAFVVVAKQQTQVAMISDISHPGQNRPFHLSVCDHYISLSASEHRLLRGSKGALLPQRQTLFLCIYAIQMPQLLLLTH